MNVPDDLRRRLESAGADISESRKIDYGTQYRVVRGSERVNLTFYDSGKINVQGKESTLKGLLDGWKVGRMPAKRSKSKRGTLVSAPDAAPRAGTDESGKGDYFGPLVVAGVRVRGAEADEALRGIGVRDSKDLDKVQALSMAGRIREALGSHDLSVICLEPPEFERRRSEAGENVNRLLGELNVEIISEIGDGVRRFVVDEFAKKARSYIEPGTPEGVELEVRTRAEDDAAVAAASILARARYLEEMERLSRWAGFTLPLGSAHVKDAARRLLSERGREGLEYAAKTSFSITASLGGGG